MTDNLIKTKIQEMYLQNQTYNTISKTLNVTKKEILEYVSTTGLLTERKKRNIKIIKDGLKKGKTREQIAHELGTAESKVSNLAANYKIPTYFKKIHFEKQENIILSEYKKNPCSILKMHRLTGIPYEACKKIYKKNNLKSIKKRQKKYLKLSEEKTVNIIQEIKKGKKSLSQIGREYGVSRQWIAHLKNKNSL